MSLDTFRHFVLFSELLAAIVGTIYFYKYKHTPIKYFLYLLWYITLTEFTGWYASENEILVFFDKNGRHYNLWLYNLLYIIFFITVLMIYMKSLKQLIFKKWIKIFIISYIIISIFNWSFIQSFKYEWSELPFITGSLFLITTIIFYFIELLRLNKIIVFYKNLLFWISIGLLLYHSGTIPFSVKITSYALLSGIHHLFFIVYFLAFMMYSTFTFGFIWSKKEE